jgi:fibronectin type 3 domain-containing protein
MSGMNKYHLPIYPLILLVIMVMIPVSTRAQMILPDIPDLIRVTVDHSDNGILIQWNPSTDTGIVTYNVYTRNPDNTFQKLIALPASTLEYKDMINGPLNLAYAVTAVNSAIPPSESLFGENVQRAVALSVEFDLCSQSNTLQWTLYEGWEGQISGYRVYGGISGGPIQELKFVSPTTTSYVHTGVDVDTSYDYYIETVNSNGIFSLSAIETVDTYFPETPSYLVIDHVTVLDQSTVELQYTADVTGEVNSFRLLRRNNPGTPFTEVGTIWNVNQSTQVIQDQFPTGTNSYQYKVQSLYLPPSCTTPLVVSESNTGNSILLVNNLQNQVVTLNWTPYEIYEPGLAEYLIQRRNGSGEFVDVGSVGPLTTQWQEPIQSVINGFQPGEVEYRVIAVGNPGTGGIEEHSYSNITTAVIETHMQVPSAFTPGSNDMNSEFKPLMDFAPRDYVLIVMDRGGRKMYETTDPGEGWNGRSQGGDFVNEAVYIYYIQYTDYTGLFKTFTGNVTVLYP